MLEKTTENSAPSSTGDVQDGGFKEADVLAGNADGLQRRLNNRQIQLIAIGGTIGTGLFVTIGAGLAKGGPGNLFLVTLGYSLIVALVNNSIAEMNTYMPVSGGFIRLAGAWVDDALGFMVGWNYFLYEALLIPFEIVALTLVLSFWSDTVTQPGPTCGVIIGTMFVYGVLNVLAVGIFGEAEFWLSGGKVILIFVLFGFTLVTMCGGRPGGGAYGFTHWSDPAAFLAYHTSGSLGHLEGFMGAVTAAAFYVVGPDYISMIAAEAKHPSHYIKTAFKTVYFRFGLFFVGGALATGIVCSPSDKTLRAIHIGGKGDGSSAAASPYVIAMENMGITVLPDIVNALLFTTIFSAGNTYTYCAVRSLYSLALEGRAPAIFKKCTAKGVPIYCFAFVMIFPLLSFLQVDSGSAEALSILLALVTGGGVIDYLVMSITFLRYHRACEVQGHDRRTRPYYGWFQPYGAWVALIVQFIVLLTYGYSAFAPWDTKTFFSNYTMQLLAPVLYFGWKFFKKTKIVKAEDVDLVWDRPIIDAYEAKMMEIDPPTSFWQEMGHGVGIGRSKKPAKSFEA